jgi:hypothetical protein
MHQDWHWGKAFYSFAPAPHGFAEQRRVIEHNAPFVRRAAEKRVVIKRAARLIAWAREAYEE